MDTEPLPEFPWAQLTWSWNIQNLTLPNAWAKLKCNKLYYLLCFLEIHRLWLNPNTWLIVQGACTQLPSLIPKIDKKTHLLSTQGLPSRFLFCLRTWLFHTIGTGHNHLPWRTILPLSTHTCSHISVTSTEKWNKCSIHPKQVMEMREDAFIPLVLCIFPAYDRDSTLILEGKPK